MATTLACVAVAGLALNGCGPGGGGGTRTAHPASATPSAQRAASSVDLKARLLRREDLPTGFIGRPLTSRNLPSGLAGCAALTTVIARDLLRHEQVEYFRPPFGPWIDEAAIEPVRAGAAELAAKLAEAVGGCGSVTVTEEGIRVRLRLSATALPATAALSATPAGGSGSAGEARAFQGDGAFHGIRLSMQIVLLRAGSVVLLVTNTALGRAADPRTTGTVVTAAVQRAVRSGG